MKLTPEEIKRRKAARFVQEPIIANPSPELRAQWTAEHAAALQRDDGTTMVVEDALDGVAQGAKRGRNLLNVVAQLITHLTPEQQLGLAQRLPELLSRQVLEVLVPLLASRLSQPDNARVHQTEKNPEQKNPFDWTPKSEGAE